MVWDGPYGHKHVGFDFVFLFFVWLGAPPLELEKLVSEMSPKGCVVLLMLSPAWYGRLLLRWCETSLACGHEHVGLDPSLSCGSFRRGR